MIFECLEMRVSASFRSIMSGRSFVNAQLNIQQQWNPWGFGHWFHYLSRTPRNQLSHKTASWIVPRVFHNHAVSDYQSINHKIWLMTCFSWKKSKLPCNSWHIWLVKIRIFWFQYQNDETASKCRRSFYLSSALVCNTMGMVSWFSRLLGVVRVV